MAWIRRHSRRAENRKIISFVAINKLSMCQIMFVTLHRDFRMLMITTKRPNLLNLGCEVTSNMAPSSTATLRRAHGHAGGLSPQHVRRVSRTRRGEDIAAVRARWQGRSVLGGGWWLEHRQTDRTCGHSTIITIWEHGKRPAEGAPLVATAMTTREPDEFDANQGADRATHSRRSVGKRGFDCRLLIHVHVVL